MAPQVVDLPVWRALFTTAGIYGSTKSDVDSAIVDTYRALLVIASTELRIESNGWAVTTWRESFIVGAPFCRDETRIFTNRIF